MLCVVAWLGWHLLLLLLLICFTIAAEKSTEEILEQLPCCGLH